MQKGKKILFIGGHATPAFAVLDELLNSNEQFDISWVGEKYNQKGNKNPSAEFITVTEKYKIPFYNLASGKLIRHSSLLGIFQSAFELFKLKLGFLKALYLVLKIKPDVIVSFGGFTAVPVVIAGKLTGAKVLTHEQTIVTGLANKIIARFADIVCVSFEQSKQYFDQKKVVFTGNPIRKSVFEIKSDLLKNFDKEPVLYITGGNQGAHEINKRVFLILPELLKDWVVVHQTGNSSVTNDFNDAKRIREELPIELKKKYVVRDYVYSDEIGEILNRASVVFSRSGANIILEILALGKLSVLLPIPWTSHNEQEKNAGFVAETGLAAVLHQSNALTPELLYEALCEAREKYMNNVGFDEEPIDIVKKNARELVKLDAGRNVYEEILRLLD